MQTGPYAGAPEGASAIPLKARGGGVRAWTWVDEADYEWACQFNWHEREGYARRNVSPKQSGEDQWRLVAMHRELMGLQPGDPREVDHINRNTLDNRRSNLRVVTKKQNGQNQGCNFRENRSSKHRGVSFYKKTNRWMAYCRLDGKLHHLGYYKDEEEAAEAAAVFRRENMPYSKEAA